MRIAIVGFLRDQFQHVCNKVREMAVEPLWVDKDQNFATYPRCDGIIVMRHTQHRWHEAARRLLPHDRVAFVHGISEAAQRICDMESRRIAQAKNGVALASA